MHLINPPSQHLASLLKGIVTCPTEVGSIVIKGLASDSRKVACGDLFIACAGPIAERPSFIEQAIQKGAVAILQEASIDTRLVNTSPAKNGQPIPLLAIPHLKARVGLIATRFYHHPGRNLTLIGVTGTNGKTSCTQFIARSLDQQNNRCGLIGTLGDGFPDDITPGGLTTPDAISLQSTLAQLKARGATHIAMEVSSHGLTQHRVAEIPFEIAVFTNLTRDHLDYHGDMIQYSQAKRLLFLTPRLRQAVINADDAFGRRLLLELATRLDCYAYSMENSASPVPTVYATNLQFHCHGLSAHIASPWGEGQLATKLLGRFNLSNLLASLTTLCLLGMPFTQALSQLSTLSTVPGRMQCFGGYNQPLVVVDYAHTPDALGKALSALREHSPGTLWCVFGCGGNRDTGKRPLMGQVAQTHSDRIILTNDNPRFEDPESIIRSILAGISDPQKVRVELDRRLAITYAIEHAQPGDIILVAGKGHENYQQIGTQQLVFNDSIEVKAQLKVSSSST